MSQILARHLKCKLSATQFLSIPMAQILNLRRSFGPQPNTERIEIRLSVGELTLIGEQLQSLWEKLVSGEIREIAVGQAPDTEQPWKLLRFETTLDPRILLPPREKSPVPAATVT